MDFTIEVLAADGERRTVVAQHPTEVQQWTAVDVESLLKGCASLLGAQAPEDEFMFHVTKNSAELTLVNVRMGDATASVEPLAIPDEALVGALKLSKKMWLKGEDSST